MVESGDQVSVTGLYRPPSLSVGPELPGTPPQINTSVPVHTIVWLQLAHSAGLTHQIAEIKRHYGDSVMEPYFTHFTQFPSP